jgi:glutamate dehydrogenase (NAD(P)+)
MRRALQAVLHTADEHRTELRTAASMIGIQRVADAVTTRGIYP